MWAVEIYRPSALIMAPYQAESFLYIRATIRIGTDLALMLLFCILCHPFKATIHNFQIECCRNINKKKETL